MRGRVRSVWMIAAVMMLVIAAVACIFAFLFGSIYNRPGGEPQETVVRFFDSLKAGDYPTMYACLSDYGTLGLEKEPENGEAGIIYSALRQSYSYTLNGDCFTEGLEATQRVNFRALNIRRVEDAVKDRVNATVEQLMAELPQEEIYSDGGGYRTEFTDRVYAAALEEVLRNPDPLCADSELVIHLQFTDGAWKMSADRALLTALTGGVA